MQMEYPNSNSEPGWGVPTPDDPICCPTRSDCFSAKPRGWNWAWSNDWSAVEEETTTADSQRFVNIMLLRENHGGKKDPCKIYIYMCGHINIYFDQYL